MYLEEAGKRIALWASTTRMVDRVYFFGSRVRNEHREDSDLDIAIELIFEDPNIALANWMLEVGNWRLQLEPLLPWRLDLQSFHETRTPTVRLGIEQSSLLVYERESLAP
jgi:predicted nucleotidyltransferase